MTKIETIKNAITEAQGKWTGADWTHQYWAPGDTREASDSANKDCTGTGAHGDCTECADAVTTARQAEDEAKTALCRLALANLASGDERARLVSLAAMSLGSAANIERQWGDAPTWGDAADLCAAEEAATDGR